jgi:hypothetical protein
MSVSRFTFHSILTAIFCLTAIIGSIIIDALIIGMLALLELIAVMLLFVPFAGTFLFRITGIDGLADGEYIDVYLADGWLHKIITFVVINAIIAGLGGLYLSIPESIRIIFGLSLVLFIITLGLKIDNAKSDYNDNQILFSDFIPTILGFGIGCYAIFRFTAAPTVIGIILLCLAAGVLVARNVLALRKW